MVAGWKLLRLAGVPVTTLHFYLGWYKMTYECKPCFANIAKLCHGQG